MLFFFVLSITRTEGKNKKNKSCCVVISAQLMPCLYFEVTHDHFLQMKFLQFNLRDLLSLSDSVLVFACVCECVSLSDTAEDCLLVEPLNETKTHPIIIDRLASLL